jgi:hypothetical protein
MRRAVEVTGGVRRISPGLWLAACLSLMSIRAQADTWTNQAGHVLTGWLVAIDGEKVVLQQANGRTLRLPLASLAPADQERARALTGNETVPPALRPFLSQAVDDIRRAAMFLEGGKINREEYDARCGQIKQRFELLATEALKPAGGQTNVSLPPQLTQRLARLASQLSSPDHH